MNVVNAFILRIYVCRSYINFVFPKTRKHWTFSLISFLVLYRSASCPVILTKWPLGEVLLKYTKKDQRFADPYFLLISYQFYNLARSTCCTTSNISRSLSSHLLNHDRSLYMIIMSNMTDFDNGIPSEVHVHFPFNQYYRRVVLSVPTGFYGALVAVL
jgi:hypothetical protein